MRGKRTDARLRGSRRRLIPAHAGKTREKSRSKTMSWAHPRACGENLLFQIQEKPLKGSSPRMRGKLVSLSPELSSRRLIPAHAGKTSHAHSRRRKRTAHPRACGENRFMQIHVMKYHGSSPRMRGKLVDPATSRRGEGLIPAHAGKTFGDIGFNAARRAHPRACGENALPPAVWGRSRGSSPRMRGKRFPFGSWCFRWGLIPAHAGKTL